MELKLNLPELEYLLVFLVEGMYESTTSDLSNYDKHLAKYKAVTNQYSEAERLKSLQSLENELGSLLNGTDHAGINQWYCEHTSHYLESDERVMDLMKRIRTFFFPSETP